MKKSLSYFFAFQLVLLATALMAQGCAKSSKNIKAKTERTSPESDAESDDHQYVDLGLPSGTLWATMNLGATSPEDYGDYFAWGETSAKDVYNESTYKWCKGDLGKLTKYSPKGDYDYGEVDNKTELELADDAAYVNWGPQWRMPSEEQIQELHDNCTSEWTTRNGVNGCLVTSKRNGESLFFPAAGYHCEGEGEPGGVGSYGNYWSRTLYVFDPALAYHLSFEAEYVDWEGYWDRTVGRSVRAVRVSQNHHPSSINDNSLSAPPKQIK